MAEGFASLMPLFIKNHLGSGKKSGILNCLETGHPDKRCQDNGGLNIDKDHK